MLTRDDNELMCRVGPGTPMGTFMREYWIPALMSDELPAPDCPPIRLRLLGENLIAFRVTSGEVGIVVNSCPHRGASMFFGRNEDEGLRCVYHGWKFDVTGACIDMPSEPAESNFKNKVRIRAYPCVERNHAIFTYMGSRTTPPPLPNLPGLDSPDCRTSKIERQCSFMQTLEGDIDTVHAAFLHNGSVQHQNTDRGSTDYYSTKVREATFHVEENRNDPTLGMTYGAARPAEEDSDYWRIGHFLLPFYTYNGPGVLTRKIGCIAWVPIDDENSMQFSFAAPVPAHLASTPGIGGLITNSVQRFGDAFTRNQQPGTQRRRLLQEPSTGWLGKFRGIQTSENDYMIDRELQSQNKIYSGIPNGAGPQDTAMQESMGPIYDRTQEHLATTDRMVIASRRKLIAACKAYCDNGTLPPGVETPDLYWMFSGGALVPKGTNGFEFTRNELYGQSELIAPIIAVG